MSALDGFRSIWSHAAATFGQGVPTGGAHIDQSARLQGLQDTVTSAAPGEGWTGSSSDSYADANTTHARRIGALASLDRRLAAEVDRAADVVSAGRRQLDGVRQWVNDAASRVPNTAAGERLLYPVISKGSSDIQEIITRSHGDLAAIAGRIRGLSGEYQALGGGEDEGKGGRQLPDDWRRPKTPDTTLDLDEIVRKPPFVPGNPDTFGPPYTIEIGPGTWLPRNDFPGVAPKPPKAPLDYRDIRVLPPDQRGESWEMELVPGSGAWVPDPHAPGYVPHPPEVPVDMATAQILDPGQLIPVGMVELYPGSRIAIPDPDFGAPR